MPGFPTIDAFPLAACAGLFGTTFLQEGVALAAGAALILKGTVPPLWVGLSLFAGIVCGDCAVYGLGALARNGGWAKRIVGAVDLKNAERWLTRRLLIAIPACHLVPWILFPTFVAFGWLKVPFARFALTSIVFSAVYVPFILTIFTLIGTAASPYLGTHLWLVWLAAGAVIIAAAGIQLLRMRRSPS